MTNLDLLNGTRPRDMYSNERVPIEIAPEVRERLSNLLNSPALAGTGVGYTAFIDRACEIAETEIAEARSKRRSTLPKPPPMRSAGAEALRERRERDA